MRSPAIAMALAAAGVCRFGAAAMSAPPASGAGGDATAPAVRVYEFHALLDGKPIGDHTFRVVVSGADRRVTSAADFSVKFLGVDVYRYHHRADERWTGDCLSALSSATDDDGKPSTVRVERDGDAYRIDRDGDADRASGCLMSYAYWNPALRGQTRLLNPQTGKVDAVRVERMGAGTIPVGGEPVAATRYRIVGAQAPIDVWYSGAGEWIGLDSPVAEGKHRLSYRL